VGNLQLEKRLNYFYMEMKFSGKSQKTIESYQFAFKVFESFCEVHQISYLDLDLKAGQAFSELSCRVWFKT